MAHSKTVISDANKDLIDQCLYPLYQKIASLISSAITPNQITLIGFSFSLLTVISLFFKEMHVTILISAISLYLYSLCDALDGVHARLTNQCSQKGGFLDHFLDNISMSLLLFAISYRFELFTPFYVFIFFLRMTTSITAFITQSETGKLPLPAIGPTCEIFTYIISFTLYYFFPIQWDLSGLAQKAPLIERFLTANNLMTINIIKATILIYLFGATLAIKDHWNYAMEYFKKIES